MRRALLLPAAALLCSSAFAATKPQTGAGHTLAERYQQAQQALTDQRNSEEKTRADRDRLAAETKELQDRLIANATKVQELEAAYEGTQTDLTRLNRTIKSIEADLYRDRDRVAHLLAVLQRLQTDQPPALALRPDDSLAAVRGTLQMGAMLPPVYQEATDLAKRLRTLADSKSAMVTKAAQARKQAEALRTARTSLDHLLEQKSADKLKTEAKLADLHDVTEEIGRETSDLKALIDRIASLRATGTAAEGMTIVTPKATKSAALALGSLRLPVIGRVTPGDPAGPGRTPGINGPLGLWFETSGKAEAVSPADSEVVFAGSYQKFGQVLILEIAGGYHLTLAGLGRIDVHIGDLVLAGEPVGVLPEGRAARLYLELRRNGQAVDPAPWMSAELRKAKGT
jgi:septal ring factor EnvC (AmiA/AmiB activator)